MQQFMMKDSSGKKSATFTAFVLGFAIVNLKLIFSGMTVGGVTLQPFTGSEYSMAVAALAALYVTRRATDPEAKKAKE